MCLFVRVCVCLFDCMFVRLFCVFARLLVCVFVCVFGCLRVSLCVLLRWCVCSVVCLSRFVFLWLVINGFLVCCLCLLGCVFVCLFA